MVAFYFCLNLLFRPLRVIADKFNVLQMGMVASDRVFKVLENDDYIKSQGTHVPASIKGKIEFDNVWFAYTDDRYVLKNISFNAEPGETVAIVGHTGSGKTSIISLMNRLYHIQKGAIRIDDVPVEEYQARCVKEGYRGGVAGCIPFFRFGDGQYYLRNPNISREQVIEAAKLIDVHDFIMQLPGGYDFNVMERGSTLSMGQRQLISFIRALLVQSFHTYSRRSHFVYRY